MRQQKLTSEETSSTKRFKSPLWPTVGGVAALLAVGFLLRLSTSSTSAPSADPKTPAPSQIAASVIAASPSAQPQMGTGQAPTHTDNKSTSNSLATTPESQNQLRIIEEILVSRNDNDLRLDRELRTLTPESKAAFRAKYSELPREDRNGLGTLVFLLGRNINSPEDLDFFAQVLEERPCLSMANCDKAESIERGEDSHREIGNDISQNYPQLNALNMLERALSGKEPLTPELRARARQIIRAALNSPVPAITQKARQIVQKLSER